MSSEPLRYPWDPAGDVIAFETPEQTRVEYRLAPLGARLVAALLDLLLLGAVTVGLALGMAGGIALLGGWAGRESALVVLGAGVAVWFLLWVLWFAAAELRGQGQTWGKRQLGLRVLALSGRPPGVGAILARNLARVVDGPLVPLWLVPTLTASRQRLGDFVAGTCVVVDRPRHELLRPLEWPAPSWRELTERRFDLPAEAAARLRPADLDLVEYVLRRVQESPPRRRMALLRPIAARYARRLGLAPELAQGASEDPRRFLGELGLLLRDRLARQAA